MESIETFWWPVRVYYEDTDAGGIVYYANYLRFMERARTELLRATGAEHEVLRERDGVLFVVKRVDIDYRSPGRLDDELLVSAEVVAWGRTSITFRQQVMRGDTCLAEARIVVVCLDTARFRPHPIPQSICEAFSAPSR